MAKEIEEEGDLVNAAGGGILDIGGGITTPLGGANGNVAASNVYYTDCLKFYRDTPENKGNRKLIRADQTQYCMPMLNSPNAVPSASTVLAPLTTSK